MKEHQLESKFQSELKKEIEARLPGAVVLKNDPSLKRSIPDLSVFYGKHWAWLECKRCEGAHQQPNQSYYTTLAQKWSFGSIINPENKEEVLNAMESAFRD